VGAACTDGEDLVAVSREDRGVVVDTSGDHAAGWNGLE
jgi:hypothetical protein